MAGKTEVKVAAASVGSLVSGVAIAVLNAVVANNSLLGGMHPVVQALILAAIPAAITWLAGYQTKSSTSTVSDGYK